MRRQQSSLAIGQQNNTINDLDAYISWKQESTTPLNYMLDPNSRYNEGECVPGAGVNFDYMGNNVGALVGHGIAKSQRLVDLDSIFSNRNVITGRGKRSNLNPINPITAFKNKEKEKCKEEVQTEYSRLTNTIYK